MKDIVKKILTLGGELLLAEGTQALMVIDDIERSYDEHTSNTLVDFGTWLQDNYSPNKEQGSKEPLPKGHMRLDFTNDVYTMTQIVKVYQARS